MTMSETNANNIEKEIAAITAVHSAMKDLNQDAQVRVLKYVAEMLKISMPTTQQSTSSNTAPKHAAPNTDYAESGGMPHAEPLLEGVSPIAIKWLARNNLQAKSLTAIFSLGADEIDLITKSIPGKSKRERLQNVAWLKGVAAYLGTGASRFSQESLKETALHYDAYDATNFAAHVKSMTADISGTKDTGYSLTPRGLANATELVKSLAAESQS